MATPTTEAAGSAPATPTQTPPERPSAKEILAALPPEQRRLAAMGKFDQIKVEPSAAAADAPATPPASETTPTAPAAPEVTEPATAAEQPNNDAAPAADTQIEAEVETPGDAAESGGSKSKRFRFADERDQAIVLISKTRNVSLLEAAKIFEADLGQKPGAAEAPAGGQAAEPSPAPDPEAARYDQGIADAQKRITELTAQRKKANEDLDNEKVLELSDQIAEARTEARLLESRKQDYLHSRQQEQHRSYKQSADESRNRVLQEFEVFANPESIERLALDAYVQRAIDDPNRQAEFKDPNWPEKIAREFAAKQGIKPKSGAAGVTPAAPTARPTVTKPAALTKQQPQQVSAPSGARLLTGADGQRTPSAPRTITREGALDLVRSDPEARKAIMRNFGKLTSGQRR